jgi:hypothetical protein
MRRFVTTTGVALGLLCSLSVSIAQDTRAPVTATHTVELADPAGDVGQIMTSDGNFPGLDVVKLAMRSDGKQITFTATLKEPPGSVASDVVKVYIDTDNDAKTGAGLRSPKIGGFEYQRPSWPASTSHGPTGLGGAPVPAAWTRRPRRS